MWYSNSGFMIVIRWRFQRSLAPDFLEVEDETGQLRVSRHGHRLVHDLNRLAWAVNVYLSTHRVDQPAESATMVDVFLHLLLRLSQAIARRQQLHHEDRANGQEPFH